MAAGVSCGPERNFRGSVCPVAKSLTFVPPMSMTKSVVGAAGGARGRGSEETVAVARFKDILGHLILWDGLGYEVVHFPRTQLFECGIKYLFFDPGVNGKGVANLAHALGLRKIIKQTDYCLSHGEAPFLKKYPFWL